MPGNYLGPERLELLGEEDAVQAREPGNDIEAQQVADNGYILQNELLRSRKESMHILRRYGHMIYIVLPLLPQLHCNKQRSLYYIMQYL